MGVPFSDAHRRTECTDGMIAANMPGFSPAQAAEVVETVANKLMDEHQAANKLK